jgi:hypothetical protein
MPDDFGPTIVADSVKLLTAARPMKSDIVQKGLQFLGFLTLTDFIGRAAVSNVIRHRADI